MPAMAPPTIPFIIRDLDKHPHEIKVPLKILDAPKQLPTPRSTPHGSPDPSIATTTTPGMARSTSDLSSYSNTSEDDVRSGSSLSFRSAAFPLSNIFKWRKNNNSGGLQSPPTDDEGCTPVNAANLDRLGCALQAQRAQMGEMTQGQLEQERKLRHIAEDRLTAVEEEVSRLCTVVLPTDNGDTGELYFANVLDSIRLAVDSYTSRATSLEERLQATTEDLKRERRARTEVDIECAALQKQAKVAADNTALESRIDDLMAQNKALQEQLSAMTLSATQASEQSALLQQKLDTANATHTTTHDQLSQQLIDCEAQRDAFRQVSQNLRQRYKLESKKTEKQMGVLRKLDANIQSIKPRPKPRPILERFTTARENL